MVPEREIESLERLIAAAITAHRDLHRVYANTAVCGGGIGGRMLTDHCGVTCRYHERHEAENKAWDRVVRAYFHRQDGDPDWAAYLEADDA